MKVEEILGLVEKVKPTQRGWRSLCPAHESDSRSLSIAEGDDGRVLLKCFRGCTVDKIAAALGLKIADLFPGDHDHYANAWTPKTPEERAAAENRRLRRQILVVELRERRTLRALSHAADVLATILQQDPETVLEQLDAYASEALDREAAQQAEQAA